jgi:hypothetical protein
MISFSFVLFRMQLLSKLSSCRYRFLLSNLSSCQYRFGSLTIIDHRGHFCIHDSSDIFFTMVITLLVDRSSSTRDWNVCLFVIYSTTISTAIVVDLFLWF